jgi:tRNA nucleotidyltransferase (CCA-adding enzyme)
MSDYMFMLDSHLSSEQSKVLAAVRDAAAEANLNLFLTGGAMRDMLGGFPIRDLDFTLEGNAIKLSKTVANRLNAKIDHIDEERKSVELVSAGGATAEIAMARQEVYGKPGAKTQVRPATIYEDLRGRDFTVNAIALSLSKASRGLLLDPANGLADIEHREIRAVSNYTLYDDPSRILRLIRFRIRLGFQIAERTQMQYQNVREAELENKIPAVALSRELRQLAAEPLAGQILQAFEEEKLISLISPALTGPKLNLHRFEKLEKARNLLPFDLNINHFALFLHALLEKLSPKERAGLMKTNNFGKTELNLETKLEASSRKLERTLTSAKLQRPSAIYGVLSKEKGELLVYLLAHSNQRLVVDRIKNYLQKYLPAAREIPEAELAEHAGKPTSPKYQKLREQYIAARLDARPKKVVPVEEVPPPPQSGPQMGRRRSTFGS